MTIDRETRRAAMWALNEDVLQARESGMLWKAIGAKFGISGQRAWQRACKALRRRRSLFLQGMVGNYDTERYGA